MLFFDLQIFVSEENEDCETIREEIVAVRHVPNYEPQAVVRPVVVKGHHVKPEQMIQPMKPRQDDPTPKTKQRLICCQPNPVRRTSERNLNIYVPPRGPKLLLARQGR